LGGYLIYYSESYVADIRNATSLNDIAFYGAVGFSLDESMVMPL